MNEEDGAGGAEGMPDISGVDGFVGNDDEEEEQDARAQDAQPIEVDIPPTYQWGVVSAQLQTWQYKSAEKTAEGTLEALRAVAFPEDPDYRCVEKSFLCASIVKGGKESVVNGRCSFYPTTDMQGTGISGSSRMWRKEGGPNWCRKEWLC